jgi:pimeloyl-ACP methyl ester carboxylesterase
VAPAWYSPASTTSDLCGWETFALLLARHGYHVLAFDFRGLGLSKEPARRSRERAYPEDVVAAATELRALGAHRVVLVGASLGGTASMIAASQVRPAPAGVVSLSGETDLDGYFATTKPALDALAAMPRLHAPLLVLVSAADPLAPAADGRLLVARAGSRDKRAVVFPGEVHGWELLAIPASAPRATRLVLGFLRAHT